MGNKKMDNEKKQRAPRSRERGQWKKNNKGTQRVQFQISCQPEEKEFISNLAQKYKITKSGFNLECIEFYEENHNS